MKLGRKAAVSGFGFAVAGVALAAVAYACTNLATLNLSTPTGSPGDTVTLTGSAFNVAKSGPSDAVVAHWNGVDGPVLAQTVPDKAGNISANIKIPEGQPGYYVIVATQRNAQGVDAYGTPARASFQILGPGGQAVAQQPSTTPGSLASEPSSSGMIALTVGLGAMGLALFGAGFTAFVRQARRRDATATARVPRG